MKKILNIVFACLMSLSLCACSQKEDASETRVFKPIEDCSITFEIPNYFYTTENEFCIVVDKDNKELSCVGTYSYFQTGLNEETGRLQSFKEYIDEVNEYVFYKYDMLTDNIAYCKINEENLKSTTYLINDKSNESYILQLQLDGCNDEEINTIINSIDFGEPDNTIQIEEK